jgi:hypothetical protein
MSFLVKRLLIEDQARLLWYQTSCMGICYNIRVTKKILSQVTTDVSGLSELLGNKTNLLHTSLMIMAGNLSSIPDVRVGETSKTVSFKINAINSVSWAARSDGLGPLTLT